MDYVESIAKAIRLKSDNFNDDLQGYIDSCKLDLINAGVEKKTVNSETDPLIKNAIIMYCKAVFGIDNTEKHQWMRMYENLKVSLKNANYQEEEKQDE